jgi:hypothetical protein
MRVLCHVKSNLGPLAPSLLFEPVTVQENVVGIEWRGPCDFTAEDLLGAKSGGGTKVEEAKAFLIEMLSTGPVEQKVVARKSVDISIAYRTVERAKQDLGVRSTRKGFGPKSVLFWELPMDEETENKSHRPHIDRQPDLAVYDGSEADPS